MKPNLYILIVLLSVSHSHASATLAGQVEIIRDHWGVPHIFADDDTAAFYGLGYAMARDRAFQMYYYVRIIEGRAAELLGDMPRAGGRETAVDHDIRMRHFGFARAATRLARELGGEEKRLLDAFSAGVNRGLREIDAAQRELFNRYGLDLEPWTPKHSILAWWYIAQFFGPDGTRDLIASRSRVAERRREVAPRPDDDAAVVRREHVTEEWLKKVQAFARRHGVGEPAASGTGNADGPRFSHAWVVGGKRTTTGSAVLVSDPQTLVGNPSLFYEFHLVCPTINARGIGVPGSPVLLIGFTPHVAWGLTALGADQADLFRITVDPANPDQYILDGEPIPFELVEETVRVRNGNSRRFTVRWTRFGPIVTRFVFARPGEGEFALKRVPVCISHRTTFKASLAMMRARTADEFGIALGDWLFPSANCVFGDRQGNIGYWVLGALPVRSPHSRGTGRFPHDGTSSRNDWQGYIPHELKPHVLNPPEGVLFSANHRPVGSFYPLYIGATTGSLGETTRSLRLRELLTRRGKFTPEDVLDVHYDCVNPVRREIVHMGLHIRATRRDGLSDDAMAALEVAAPWYESGARMCQDSPGAILAGEIQTLFRVVVSPLAARWGGGQSGQALWLKDWLKRLKSAGKAGCVLTDSEVAYVDRLLSDAWRSAVRKYGENPDEWVAAAARQRRPSLGYQVNLSRFPTLNRAYDVPAPRLSCTDGSTIRSQAAQAYTQYVPLHNPDEAMSVLPIGASESPESPYRTSTLKLWGDGALHPAPLSRAAVERIAQGPPELLAWPE